MERLAVQSKDIALVGYDSGENTLEVVFRSGGVYHYKKVPAEVHRDFLEAPSLGIYFRDNIKEKFSFEKIS